MFTINDARVAVLRIAQVKGKTRAALIERMFRLETAHFESRQYALTGSAGMERGKWSRAGMPSNISYIKMRDNHTQKLVDFIVWPNVYDFCLYLSNYIDRYNGNWARWNSTKAAAQHDYRIKVKNIRNRWILNSTVVEDELKNITDEPFQDSGINSSRRKNRVESNWNIQVGEKAINDEIVEEEEIPEDEYVTKLSGVETKEASGIWQIIKLVADQYSLSQNVNDATIAFSQGSLLNYIQKVVQSPWLEFFGDTVGDQYYFQCRKEPFDKKGYLKLPMVKSIQENEVLDTDLSWYEGDVFSWYQIIPRGSFLGQQNLIFAYVKAVFFEEYAEIWGSKPNIQVSNYLNFNKIDDDNKMFNKAIDDLRYMVESNAYLPFTRKGMIVINLDNSIRRGYKIFHEPTGEFFYVDSVTHAYYTGEDGPRGTTTLLVSRGIMKKYFESYFDIISFDNPKPLEQQITTKVQDGDLVFFFDNGRSNIIDLEENFEDSTNGTDIKMLNQISEYPELRNDLNVINQSSIVSIGNYIQKHKGQRFKIIGNVDEDAANVFLDLPRKRAETIKSIIVSEYLKKYNDMTKAELENSIDVEANANADSSYQIDSAGNSIESEVVEMPTLKDKAYKRNATFTVIPYDKKEIKKIEQKDVAWKVNRNTFQFFLNRKQFVNGQ